MKKTCPGNVGDRGAHLAPCMDNIHSKGIHSISTKRSTKRRSTLIRALEIEWETRFTKLLKCPLPQNIIFFPKWIFAPLLNKSCHFIGFKTCEKPSIFRSQLSQKGRGYIHNWCHKLIYIAINLCKNACKVDCDVKWGKDPLPFWLSREQKMLGFPPVLKPIK